jgi:hypothetical protein
MAMPSRWSWSKRNLGAGRLHCDALRLQFFGNLRELVGAAGDEHQVVMVAGEEFGEFVSDAAGGTGDEDVSGRHSESFGVSSSSCC